MSNGNTIADAILRQNNSQPIILTSANSFHQCFALNGQPVNVTVPNPMAMIDSSEFFPGRSATGLSFVVRAAGLVTGGERYQVDINLGATALNAVVASTGLAINGLTADNWLIEAECMWDALSTNLRGIYWGWAGLQQVSQASLVTAQQPSALTSLVFNCAVTCANSNANAVFTLTDFSIDMN